MNNVRNSCQTIFHIYIIIFESKKTLHIIKKKLSREIKFKSYQNASNLSSQFELDNWTLLAIKGKMLKKYDKSFNIY